MGARGLGGCSIVGPIWPRSSGCSTPNNRRSARDGGKTALVWFERLTGFEERRSSDVAGQFDVEGEWMTSQANGRRMRPGRFELPSLAELRKRREPYWTGQGLRFDQIVADVQSLTRSARLGRRRVPGALRSSTCSRWSRRTSRRSSGVDGYEHDRTQGPACADRRAVRGRSTATTSCQCDGGTGQTATTTAQRARRISPRRSTSTSRCATATRCRPRAQLQTIAAQLHGADEATHDRLMGRSSGRRAVETPRSRSSDAGHTVTQVYCSALPSRVHVDPGGRDGTPFTRLVLDAAYEATFAVAVANAAQTGNASLYLTLLGAGAFGNPGRVGARRRSSGRGACTPTTASTCTSCRTGRAGRRSTR